MIIDHQTSSELSVIGVVAGLHHRTRLGCELVKLRRVDPVLDLRTDLLRYDIGVYMLKSVGKLLDASENLIE
jgi:hypothetical protein